MVSIISDDFQCDRNTPCKSCIDRGLQSECRYLTTDEDRLQISRAHIIDKLRREVNRLKHRLADAERADQSEATAATIPASSRSSLHPTRARFTAAPPGSSRLSPVLSSSNNFQTGGMSISPAPQFAFPYASQAMSVPLVRDGTNRDIQMGYAEQSHLNQSSSSGWNVSSSEWRVEEAGFGGGGGGGGMPVGVPTPTPPWSTVASPATSSTTTTTTTSRTSGSSGSQAGHSIVPLNTTSGNLDNYSQYDWTTMTVPPYTPQQQQQQHLLSMNSCDAPNYALEYRGSGTSLSTINYNNSNHPTPQTSFNTVLAPSNSSHSHSQSMFTSMSMPIEVPTDWATDQINWHYQNQMATATQIAEIPYQLPSQPHNQPISTSMQRVNSNENTDDWQGKEELLELILDTLCSCDDEWRAVVVNIVRNSPTPEEALMGISRALLPRGRSTMEVGMAENGG